jgi:hypothetical protein
VPSGTYSRCLPTHLLQVKLADELEVQVLERRARPTGQPSSGALRSTGRTHDSAPPTATAVSNGSVSAYGAVGRLRAGRKGLVAERGVAWWSDKRGQRSVAVQSAQAERWFRRKRHRDLIERIRSTSGLMCRGSPLFGLHATAPLSVERGRAHPRAMAERRMLSSAAAIVIDTFLELILHTRRHRCESHTLANAR